MGKQVRKRRIAVEVSRKEQCECPDLSCGCVVSHTTSGHSVPDDQVADALGADSLDELGMRITYSPNFIGNMRFK